MQGMGVSWCKLTVVMGLGLAISATPVVAQGRPDLSAAVDGNGSTADTAATAPEASDYALSNDAYNGLTSFRDLVIGLGLQFEPRDTLDFATITAQDIVVVLYPQSAIDAAAMLGLISAGGHVMFADDFGATRDVMLRLGLIRNEVETLRAPRYFQNLPYAPMLPVKSPHPIAADVEEVVANYPAIFARVDNGVRVVDSPDGALLVAGERGSGRYVAVADASLFINRMLEFPGNLRLVTNSLRWLMRDGHATRVVLITGAAVFTGQAPAFIDSASGDTWSRALGAINRWLDERSTWLLVPVAMRLIGIGAGLALLLLLWRILAARKAPPIDGRWLRVTTAPRYDDPVRLLSQVEGASTPIFAACVVRDRVNQLLAQRVGVPDPLHQMSERELQARLAATVSPAAQKAYESIGPRLRRLPNRGQAATAWGGGMMPTREFASLYEECEQLCRTLGTSLVGSPAH